MKRIKTTLTALIFGLFISTAAGAQWWGNSYGYPGGNDWPEWTPMYWMDEMSDGRYNNGDWWHYGGGPWGGVPYGGNPWGSSWGSPWSSSWGNAPWGGSTWGGSPWSGPWGGGGPWNRSWGYY